MTFFLAGMPRCRTAWFAEYLSAYPDVICHHELLNGLQSRQEFYDEMEKPGYIGNSDSGLCITDFQQRWPDAPTVVLMRNPLDVHKSLTAFLGIEPSLEFVHRQMIAAQATNGLKVWYSEIDDRIEEIHEHIGIPFDEEIYKRYRMKNIQVEEIKVCLESYKLWMNFEEVA
jgi:hypothetical protein